jgi:DNA-binding response OmpR family regulator
MKLLVASCFNDLSDRIDACLRGAGLVAELTPVHSADEVLQTLAGDRYDGLCSTYALDDIDIWQLSVLVQSNRFADYPVPVYLIQEGYETEIPLILANDYHFKVCALEQLAQVLSSPASPNDFKPTLLIIEDEPDAASIALNTLADHYRIDVAYDGQVGYERWLQHRHDLILLDLMLPGLSGDEVLANILAIDSDQPVIIVTAFAGLENHKNLVLNGASEFLGKPYRLTDLRRLCRIVSNRARLVSEIHYREDKFKQLSAQLWLLDHCLATNDLVHSRAVMQRIQAMLPAAPPSDDEQFTLLQSVAPE